MSTQTARGYSVFYTVDQLPFTICNGIDCVFWLNDPSFIKKFKNKAINKNKKKKLTELKLFDQTAHFSPTYNAAHIKSCVYLIFPDIKFQK